MINRLCMMILLITEMKDYFFTKFKLLFNYSVFLFLIFLSLGCSKNLVNKNEIYQQNCSNEDFVKKIAEQEWLKLYGKKIYNNKPFKANLKNNVWTIEGTLNTQKGGIPYIEINSKNCKVIKIYHGK